MRRFFKAIATRLTAWPTATARSTHRIICSTSWARSTCIRGYEACPRRHGPRRRFFHRRRRLPPGKIRGSVRPRRAGHRGRPRSGHLRPGDGRGRRGRAANCPRLAFGPFAEQSDARRRNRAVRSRARKSRHRRARAERLIRAMAAIAGKTSVDAGADPVHLGLIPSVLVVPPALLESAKRLCRAMQTGNETDLEVRVESRMSATGMVDPRRANSPRCCRAPMQTGSWPRGASRPPA